MLQQLGRTLGSWDEQLADLFVDFDDLAVCLKGVGILDFEVVVTKIGWCATANWPKVVRWFRWFEPKSTHNRQDSSVISHIHSKPFFCSWCCSALVEDLVLSQSFRQGICGGFKQTSLEAFRSTRWASCLEIAKETRRFCDPIQICCSEPPDPKNECHIFGDRYFAFLLILLAEAETAGRWSIWTPHRTWRNSVSWMLGCWDAGNLSLWSIHFITLWFRNVECRSNHHILHTIPCNKDSEVYCLNISCTYNIKKYYGYQCNIILQYITTSICFWFTQRVKHTEEVKGVA